MTLDDLANSTGHAPGEATVEIQPELELPHDLPLRVTPMSPVSEIAAIGQLARAPRNRRALARRVAILWLALICLPLFWSVLARF